MARRPTHGFPGDVSGGRGGEVRAYWIDFYRDIRDSYDSLYPDGRHHDYQHIWLGSLATFESREPIDLEGSDVEIAHNVMLPGIFRRRWYRLMPNDAIIEVPDDEE